MPFVKSKCPLPTRSLRLLRAAVRSTTFALWLHYACKRSNPFVEYSGFVSHVEKHRSIGLVTEMWSPRFVTEYWNVFFSHLPCYCNVFSHPFLPFFFGIPSTTPHLTASGPCIVWVKPPRAVVSKTWRNDGRVFWASRKCIWEASTRFKS